MGDGGGQHRAGLLVDRAAPARAPAPGAARPARRAAGRPRRPRAGARAGSGSGRRRRRRGCGCRRPRAARRAACARRGRWSRASSGWSVRWPTATSRRISCAGSDRLLDAQHQRVAQRVGRRAAAVEPGGEQLLAVQRVAARARPQPLQQVGLGRRAEDVGELVGELLAGQRLERDAAGARVALDLGQQRAQRVAAVQLVGPVGADQEHALGHQAARQEGERRPRRAIGPVQVLDQQQHRALLAERVEQRQEALEQARLGAVLAPPGSRARARGGAAPRPRAPARSAPGRRSGRAGAARPRAARRAARSRRGRRSRRPARARRPRSPGARARRAGATCRRPTRRPGTRSRAARRRPRRARPRAPPARRHGRSAVCS